MVVEDPVSELFAACKSADTVRLAALLKAGCDLFVTDEETGRWPLHYAAESGSLECVQLLISNHHPWNVVDKQGITAGEIAKSLHFDIYHELVEEGVRAELIFGLIGRKEKDADMKAADDDNVNETDAVEENDEAKDYLSQPLHITPDKILDANNDAVMMEWETPLMQHHADILCPISGLHVLNVGFGMGIIDRMLQAHSPASHTIIEAHPDVYKKMVLDGWTTKLNVKVVFGKWQDVIEDLGETYDAIFFDTFGEYYADLRDFHEHVANLLNDGGIYSFFNGLGGHNVFFHDVYCRVAELDLEDMGLSVEYVPIQFTPPGDQVWEGVNRPYWVLGQYNLPVCRLITDI
ncbi:hypothetical protein SmJEL517_g02018 [Synchytrium microbalum]|uniref:Arginine N-methyltransferase 2 n=1 Tax=Synchytrium microbalum TaxID=1806994 RepID=A0A507CCP6_9FUNG|nr:uncharacterized protein SmJEL517_g02018 [Synchytrium microbalum]TPX35694.1 hypothetical protein SmJEL517_g02018 [Synchytrium microbalum]